LEVSNNIIVTHGQIEREVSLPVVSFIHNFEEYSIHQVIKQEFDIFTEFLNFKIMNLNSCLEILSIIGKGE
jgi:hypothetical protein